jgi:hypothetical protein
MASKPTQQAPALPWMVVGDCGDSALFRPLDEERAYLVQIKCTVSVVKTAVIITIISAERRKATPMIKREASCGCGQLQIICEDDPVRVSMCHCLACQRRTGSTFGVQAWYARARADSGRTVTFSFCPECGGTVFWEPERSPDLIAVAVGAFADPDFEKPSLSVRERRMHPWTVAIGEQQIEHAD